jgi:predicted nucleic acid-binding protein
MRLLLDSVILIDHFNNVPAATAYLRENQPDSAISVITRAEVMTGFEPPEAKLAARLLDRFPTLVVDVQVADLAAALRREQGWKLPDAIQAALAEIHNLRLVTRNLRDFPPEQYKFVLIPYRL